ncbi:hypothetical protein FA95DRAFT_1563766 [Auriscalpium vulgare]|uniref:Uncharacterized protein n=1 Tax=Auriscalpium vulgare TaxID=40419 RepID=A0ACB8RHB0_9AGAM|nr:hypothetical protein FA95DRAFT_1563766 [Auriscalpium vulgare]
MARTCPICLDALNKPSALPCGHIFCLECINAAARMSRSLSDMYCPVCRAPCPKEPLDPRIVPRHLRPYIFAPFRQLYLNDVTAADAECHSLQLAGEQSAPRNERMACQRSPAHLEEQLAAARAEHNLLLRKYNALLEMCWRGAGQR